MAMLGCRPLTDDELSRVQHAFSGTFERRNRALFVLGYTTGFRISELLSLRVKDVLAGSGLVKHVKVPRRNMKARRASRSAILAPVARSFLQAWLDELEAELNTAKEDKGRLHDALQNLYDEQNGVPLLHHETTWQAAMEEAEKLLKMKL